MGGVRVLFIDFNSSKPIFSQLADELEDAILKGSLPEESRIPSITELAASLRINPATALKGVNLLVDSGTVYKKRGVGMFVSEGARTSIMKARRTVFFEDNIKPLLSEAKQLNINRDELMEMINRGYEE